MPKQTWCVVFVGLLLSSCAPQLLGSRGNPAELKSGAVLEVNAGKESFFKIQAPVGLIDPTTRNQVFASDFKDISQISPGRFATYPVVWFRLGRVEAPSGVKLEFVYQEARREVQNTDTNSKPGYVSFYLVDTASIIGVVRTPTDTPPGTYKAALEIVAQADPKNSAQLQYTLVINPPAK